MLDQFRGTACVNVTFPDDGTPGILKHVVGKRRVNYV